MSKFSELFPSTGGSGSGGNSGGNDDPTTIINEIEQGIDAYYDLLNTTTKVVLTYGVDSDVSSYQHPKTQISFEYDEQGRLIDRQIIAIKPIASSNASKYRYIEFDDELLVPVADGSAVMIERIKFNPLSTTHLTKVSYYDIIPNTYLIKNTTTRILDLDSASEISESGLYIPYFNNNEVIFITNIESLADGTISLGCAMPGSSCKLVFRHPVTISLVIKALDTDPNNLLNESYTTISAIGWVGPSSEIYLWCNPDTGSIEVLSY